MHASNRPLCTMVLLVGLSLFIWNCTGSSGSKTLKLGHGLEPTHPVHKGMVYMAERLAEKSGGKLQLEIYPSQQLGTERELLELLQIGSLAITKVSGAVLENFSPKIRVFGIPYLFRDREHLHKVFDSDVGRELLLECERYWLRGLTYFDAGERSFYTKEKPIESPDDLKGMKIRVQESVTAMSMVESLGGAPTPISFGELYTALQQGIVDGAENNAPSFYTSRHYEICKYYSLDGHSAVPDVLIVGKVAWENLNEQEQKWLQEAADEASVKERVLWAEAEQEALEEVQKAGVKINYPDKTPFAEKTKSLLDTYRSDKDLYNIIERIQAIH